MSGKRSDLPGANVTQSILKPRSLGQDMAERLTTGWAELVNNRKFQIALTLIFGFLTVIIATYGERIEPFRLVENPEATSSEAPEDSIGGIASRDILATHDFTRVALADHNANEKRERVRSEVLPIWTHNETEVSQIHNDLRSALRYVREDLCAAFIAEQNTDEADAEAQEEALAELQRNCRSHGLREGELSPGKRIEAACSPSSIERFKQRLKIDAFSKKDCDVMAAEGITDNLQKILHDRLADVMVQPIVSNADAFRASSVNGIRFDRSIDGERTEGETLLKFDNIQSLESVRTSITRDEAFRLDSSMSEPLKVAIRNLVAQMVRPNMVEEKELTELLRDQRAGQVLDDIEPRSYKRGERILGRGEVITPYVADTVQQMHLSAPRIVAWYWDALALALLLGIAILAIGSASKTFQYSWSTRNITMMGAVLLLNVLLLKFCVNYADSTHFDDGFFSRDEILIALPYAAGAIVISTLAGTGNAVAFAIILGLVVAVMSRYELAWFLVPLLSSLMGAVAAHRISRRGKLVAAAMIASGGLIFVTFALVSAGIFDIDTRGLPLLAALLLSGSLNVILATSLVLIVEIVFNYTTAFRLQEWLSTNNRLMDQLNGAGGTLAHSQNVALLVAEACQAIGADPLLGRAGALYHDIGKVKNPLYFGENQSGENPHNYISERESARIIIDHVKDGIILGKAGKLPPELIEFIATHHGTMMTRHFYNKTVEKEGIENVREEDFRYPGPVPSTKETAICLLADGVEAAVRALPEKNDTTIRRQMEKIIESAISENQLREAPLTFKDLEIIKDTFFNRLKAMHHSRPQYAEAPQKSSVDKVLEDGLVKGSAR